MLINRKFLQTLKVLTVEIIWRLWGSGRFKQNKALKLIVDNWLDYWVEWKTELTMNSVDQADAIKMKWELDDQEKTVFTFTEKKNGETLLGGEMRLRAPWKAKEEP